MAGSKVAVELGEPVVVAVSQVNEARWGFHQFPALTRLPDGTILLEERQVSADWDWVKVRWIVIRNQRTAEHRFGHRLYSASKLKGLLASVGFTALRACGSLEGAPYDHQAERLVILARKPPAQSTPHTRARSG